MIQLVKNRDYYGIGLFLLLLVMIGYQKWISPAIGIFVLIVLAEGFIFKSLTFKFNRYNALFILLFLFYLLGLIWAEHREVGWKLLEYKMSFFIFPILFFFHKQSTNVWNVLQGLVFGCVILATQFFYQLYFANEIPIAAYEISRETLQLHPTYSSIYLTIASIFLIYGWATKKINWSVFIVVPLVVVFSYLVFLITSFAAILYLGLAVAIGIGILIFTRLKWVGLIIYLMISPIALYFTITKIDSLKYDLEMVNAVYLELKEGKESFLEKNKTEVSGTKERVMMWYISSEIIAENPMGVGTGDIDFYLVKKCEKYKLEILKTANLNPHNQFLQIGIDIGFLGLFWLVFMLGAFFYLAIKSKNYLLFFITLSLAFNGLFESVLQRQSGIVFFAAIISLVIVANDQFSWKRKSD